MLAPNQFVIYTDKGRYFQSYESIIAFIPKGGKGLVTLGPQWRASNTTSKYRAKFLGETTKETQKLLDSGEYALDVNLKVE